MFLNEYYNVYGSLEKMLLDFYLASVIGIVSSCILGGKKLQSDSCWFQVRLELILNCLFPAVQALDDK